MATLKKWTQNENETIYCFFCPGCEREHVITSNRHTVMGDLDKPTVSPSILYNNFDPKCHSFIRNGRIEFLMDCTHILKGQTVDLPNKY